MTALHSWALAITIATGVSVSAHAEEIHCSDFGGVLTGSITDKLIVDVDCLVEEASLTGNVSFAGPFVLTIVDSEVRGNIECSQGGGVTISHSEVTGNLDGCGEPFKPDKKRVSFFAELDGFQEVPAISTSGFGTFLAWVEKKEEVLHFELSYDDLEGGDVLFAHIHFGRPGTNGGVIAFLCSNVPPPVGVDAPPCPTPGGSLEGVLGPSDVVGPVDQGIAPGEADEAFRALLAGAAYVNVHTDGFPDGEIRGQIEASRRPKRR
jgi:hypothetical protein